MKYCTAAAFVFLLFFVPPSLGRFLTKEYIDKFGVKLWQDYKLGYRKEYEGAGEEGSEDHQRYLVFLENLHTVRDLEAENDPAHTMWGYTTYSDWTKDDFKASLIGDGLPASGYEAADPLPIADSSFLADVPNDSVPATLDERRDTMISGHVKYQGKCAVSGLFAAASAIEGSYMRNGSAVGYLYSVSEQWLLECVARDLCPCSGSARCTPTAVLKAAAAANQGRVPAEKDHMYAQRDGGEIPSCEASQQEDHAAQILSVFSLENTEDFLKKWLFKNGPFAASVAKADTWQLYQEGVVKSSCSGDGSRGVAAVSVIGYSTDGKGNAYWIAKTSWGAAWGEHGYIRLSRGHNCLIDPVGVLAKEGPRPSRPSASEEL